MPSSHSEDPMSKKKVALYLRVSTNNGHQTTENQERELRAIADRSGWEIVATYSDQLSGARGRDRRPGLDALMKAATKREFGMVAAWSVDRLGRSLQHLVELFADFQALGVDLYLHQQHVDSSTPSGRALLQMSGVFAEFERAMLKERVHAGLARARAQGKHIGRRRTTGATDDAILKLRSQGLGVHAIRKRLGCGAGRVQAVIKKGLLA
jgi:DNA invertase Pin-like site-specific DNA recombinase